MKTYQPESITLGATLLAQAKGDVGQARRAAGGAHDWLASIDPDHKAKTEAPASGDDNAAVLAEAADEIERLNAKLDAYHADASESSAIIAAVREAIPPALLDRTGGDVPKAVQLLRAIADKAVEQRTPTAAPTPAPAKPKAEPKPTPKAADADAFDPSCIPGGLKSPAMVAFYKAKWAAGWRPDGPSID